MKTIHYTEAEKKKNPHGVDVRNLYSTDDAMVNHLTLKPGEKLKRHITPVDVFFYVLEGKGVVEIGGEEKEVGKDTLIDSPAGIPHNWFNRSDADLRILVAKVPRPTEATKFTE